MPGLLAELLADAGGEGLLALQQQPILGVRPLQQTNRTAGPHGTDTDGLQGGVDQGEVLQLMAAMGRQALAIARQKEGDRFAVAWNGGRVQVRF